MRIICGHAVILTLAMVAALSPAAAEDRRLPSDDRVAAPDAAATSPASATSTGKERLGGKWTDEQRTDNCKVPVDKRGTRPRPDTCADDPASRDARGGR
jgi:hypothetical protein